MVCRQQFVAALLLLALGVLPGCVSRRMTIRSNPPGALVEVDGERLGVTPLSQDFTYYGTHQIKLSAPGYNTLTVQQPVRTPWYQHFPIDFISNHFSPYQIHDRHEFMYSLQPDIPAIDEEQQLIDRAGNFRSRSHLTAP